MMKKFAKTVLDAQRIREESFDKKASDKAFDSEKFVDHSTFYQKTMSQSAQEAAVKNGFGNDGALPIYLLNEYAWNDIQFWATEVMKKV